MTTVFVDTSSIPRTAPVHLNLHLVTTLQFGPDDARRQVNRQVVPELGTGLIARDPELVITGEHVIWRVPLVLSLPGLGDLGQIGAVDVDAHTCDLLLSPATRQRIIRHARRLYTGATLQTE